MDNVAKFLPILESLEFSDSNPDAKKKQNEHDRIIKNLSVLKNYIKEGELLTQVCELKHQDLTQSEAISSYCHYLKHVLLNIVDRINFNSDAKEDLISTRHLNLCIAAAQDLGYFALNQQLHPLLCIKGVFATAQGAASNETLRYANLQHYLGIFKKILLIKQFHVSNAMASVLRDYMAAIFTLFVAHSLKECTLSDAELLELKEKLDIIWLQITKTEYFRNILMLKGCRQLPGDVQKRLHHELLQKLASPDGFTTLVATLVTASQHSETQSSKQTFEIIANIVAFKGHSLRFQENMLQQIYKFINLCLKHADSVMLENMGAGLLALRRLYDLNAQNQKNIKIRLEDSLSQLVKPVDLLSGLILMEHEEFYLIVSQFYHLFCTSIVECLPSELLIPYIPLLLQLFDSLPPSMLQRKQVAQLITRCLANRSPSQLHVILGKLYRQEFDENWRQLHKRILILPNVELTTVNLKIAPADNKQDLSISLALPEVLLSGEHNILTYQVFMSLLQHMDECLLKENDVDDIDLLQTQEDLITFLNSKYPVKVDILLSLNTLVAYDGLKTQLAENANDFLSLLKKLLVKRINFESHNSQLESADQTLLIMLTLTQEVLEYTQQPEQLVDFIPKLEILKARSPNQLVRQRIDCLLALLSGNTSIKTSTMQLNTTPFSEARSLIESHESHLQVYGIQTLLNLLRRRDAVTLANTHVIIALALTTLKNKESYTFLNCVRLFVALLDVMEAEVLELLADEYLNKQASLDLRLVVGEAILKVSKELGPLSHKYKDVLLTCFMHGARSPIDELRWSSYSNLSQLCRTLSYQVHSFFHELMNLIDSELSTGTYLPARRAAVLVISELLEGMENLIDFEDMLLPLYRLLKTIEANEDGDEKMRLHAANGLKALTEKCKKFLFPERNFEKPIKILGIQEQSPTIKTKIIELN